MIRVHVPIDLSVVADTRTEAFAIATPLRIATLIELAVREALGRRAPEDKRERAMHSMLRGLNDGTYVVDVDGRIFDSPDAVVMCAGTVALRFFGRRGAFAPHQRPHD